MVGGQKRNADDRMPSVIQTTGCWFLGKWLRRLEVQRQMATWCTDSPMKLHTQQEIYLWDGSLSVMPLIWVWWRTQEPCGSRGDFQPSLKGFLRDQMWCAMNLIPLHSSLKSILSGYTLTFIYGSDCLPLNSFHFYDLWWELRYLFC